MLTSCGASASATAPGEPTFAATAASIGAATFAFAATAPSIGAVRFAFAWMLTFASSRLPPFSSDCTPPVVPPTTSPAAPVAPPTAPPTAPVGAVDGAAPPAAPVAPSTAPPTCAARAAAPAAAPVAPSTAPPTAPVAPSTAPVAPRPLPVPPRPWSGAAGRIDGGVVPSRCRSGRGGTGAGRPASALLFWSMLACCGAVAVALAADSLVDRAVLLRQADGLRVRAQDVGRCGGLDRCGDVQVRCHCEVDGRGKIQARGRRSRSRRAGTSLPCSGARRRLPPRPHPWTRGRGLSPGPPSG